jgi:hypothetical protein
MLIQTGLNVLFLICRNPLQIQKNLMKVAFQMEVTCPLPS